MDNNRLLAIHILEILNEHSSRNNKITQKEISYYLENNLHITFLTSISNDEFVTYADKFFTFWHYRDQYIRHSPINGFKTFLVLHKARLLCPNCNCKFYANYSDIVNPRFRCSNTFFFDIINMRIDLICNFRNFFNI